MRCKPIMLALCLTSSVSAAQSPRLGTITFPTSGPPAGQAHFIRGVLFLHSFEYGSAAQAFREAQQAAPDFAMAYWGEAMTYNHPLWGEWDEQAARGALGRLAPTPEARRARAPTERERMYLDAVEALWAEGPKPERDTAYSLAMERLVSAFPDDDEARTFHALSILGLSGTTRVFASYMRAAAVAQQVFSRSPDHPGAAHYLIHSFDDPIHAPLGLPAARAYSGIAPDAAHAQHMTTHIFLAQGMWDDVVSQNRIAAELTSWGPGHFTAWLHYGLLQQGKLRAAQEQLERSRSEMASPPRVGQRLYLLTMRAHHVIGTERWDDPSLGWSIDGTGIRGVVPALDAFVAGYAAVKRGDAAAARVRLAALRDSAANDRVRVMALELEAMLVDDRDRAIALLEEAAALEETLPLEFGPPDIVKPSHELLGEVLLEAGRPADAQRAFEGALRLAPKRALSLRGLGRAATRAGDHEAARRAWSTLLEIWHDADPGLPALAEARRFAGRGTR